MHLNTKTKLKDYHQCLWSNLLHYGCPSRCQTNIFFISNKEIIQKDTQRFRKIFNVFLHKIPLHQEKGSYYCCYPVLWYHFWWFGLQFQQCSIAPVPLSTPSKIETKTPFAAWLQIRVMSKKRFLQFYSLIYRKYYILLIRIISYGAYFNYFSSTFFIRNQSCWYLKRTVAFS